MRKLIGLTGQTGAGKTTVASMFSQRGYFVIDGDVLAREIVGASSPVLGELVKRFGNQILDENGALIRKELARAAFSCEANTAALNEITHPAIIKLALEMAEDAFSKGFRYAVFDAAALLESGIDGLCYKTVSVIAPVQTRLERIVKRDSITYEQAMQRINAQKNEQYYISHSDIIIRNSPPYSLNEEFDNAVSIIEMTGGNDTHNE